MAQLKTDFLTVSPKSEFAPVAEYMTLMNLDRAAYFEIKNPSVQKRDALYACMKGQEYARIPRNLEQHPKARRMLVIIKAKDQFSDLQYIEDYRSLLKHIYGPKCRYAVRVCHRITRLVEEANYGK